MILKRIRRQLRIVWKIIKDVGFGLICLSLLGLIPLAVAGGLLIGGPEAPFTLVNFLLGYGMATYMIAGFCCVPFFSRSNLVHLLLFIPVVVGWPLFVIVKWLRKWRFPRYATWATAWSATLEDTQDATKGITEAARWPGQDTLTALKRGTQDALTESLTKLEEAL